MEVNRYLHILRQEENLLVETMQRQIQINLFHNVSQVPMCKINVNCNKRVLLLVADRLRRELKVYVRLLQHALQHLLLSQQPQRVVILLELKQLRPLALLRQFAVEVRLQRRHAVLHREHKALAL